MIELLLKFNEVVIELLVKLNEDRSLDLTGHPKIQARIQAGLVSTALFTNTSTLVAFQARFHSEEACADYLFTHK